jgi:haloacetate dehalogenase
VWRYFFLIQPASLPEQPIVASADFYLDWTLNEWCGTPGALNSVALAEYRHCFDGATIRVSCEGYRTGATSDLDHDVADAHRENVCPVLVLWSQHGIGSTYDVLASWRRQERWGSAPGGSGE